MVDVFPRRNLPPLAEQWGREVENRIVSSETGIETLQQGLSGQNRNTASSLSLIAQQIEDLRATQATIPITSSTSSFSTDFPITAMDPSWQTVVRIDIPTPPGRNNLNISCIANARLYENTATPTAFSQAIIRVYSASTDSLLWGGGSAPGVRSGQVTSTFHSCTAILGAQVTTPDEGIYVVFQVSSTIPANFPADNRNLAELVVQTSFL